MFCRARADCQKMNMIPRHSNCSRGALCAFSTTPRRILQKASLWKEYVVRCWRKLTQNMQSCTVFLFLVGASSWLLLSIPWIYNLSNYFRPFQMRARMYRKLERFVTCWKVRVRPTFCQVQYNDWMQIVKFFNGVCILCIWWLVLRSKWRTICVCWTALIYGCVQCAKRQSLRTKIQRYP